PVRDVAIWEWSNKSEVFGNQAPGVDPDGDGVAFELALRFPGQQATDASGMFYNYQRDYDPAVGRYSQSDPIGLRGGLSTFAYVSSSPIQRVDPAGLEESIPQLTGSEGAGPGFNWRYYVDRTLEAIGYPVTVPASAAVQTSGYRDMRNDNTTFNDKYFHCVANCQSRRVAGSLAACAVATAREDSQEVANWHNEDRLADEAANAYGRDNAGQAGSCQEICSKYIVNGINQRYLPGIK
ncbi:RHS repeat-associated core domain-containing protein, partial [Stenotrophomonas sp.]|uniref:RHS repeat-associated core domain-containing protein n=1 Tax=Stenotrophomonas sp. TaxID=69392 RepID=UPI0028AABE11